MTLDFTDHRLAEMINLQWAGRTIPEKLIKRYQVELEQALQLAAAFNNPDMAPSLEQIRLRAEEQLVWIPGLMAGNPETPALANLQARLQEQVQEAEAGVTDPQGFQVKVNHQTQSGKGNPGAGQGSANGPKGTPVPARNGNGSSGNQTSATPRQGQNNSGGTNPPKRQETLAAGRLLRHEPMGPEETPGTGHERNHKTLQVIPEVPCEKYGNSF